MNNISSQYLGYLTHLQGYPFCVCGGGGGGGGGWGRYCRVNSAKKAMGQAEQDPDFSCSASNILDKVQYHLCLKEWQGLSGSAGRASQL